ncbi:MAG: hypothetical protein HC875_40730, partial [Anaerolineales bacterium]|nr:hypothetical protein [Anaerolineales bacterium]
LLSEGPLTSINLLKQVIEKFPDTWTAANLVLDDIIDIATSNKLWDEAIEACIKAESVKPSYKQSYMLQAEACRLFKAGKELQAIEVLFKKDTLHGKWSGTICSYGDKFARLGARDKAWQLYNEAVGLAVKEGKSPHSIRESMATFLIEEKKLGQAVEILIYGASEALPLIKKGELPKSYISSLKKALKIAGIINIGELLEEILIDCRNLTPEIAVAKFRKNFDSNSEKNG